MLHHNKKILSIVVIILTFLNITELKAVILTKDHNEFQVAEQLASISSPTPAETTLIANINVLEPFQKRAILDKMSGSQYVELQAGTELSVREFIRRLYDPLRPFIETDVVCDPNDNCYSTWLEGSGQRSFFHGDHRAHGFNSSGYAISGGFQARYCEDFIFGAAASYDHQHYKFSIGNSSSEGNTILGAVYALYRPVDFYLLADLVFGTSRNQLKRSFDVGLLEYKASSHPRSFDGDFYFEAGFDYPWEYQCLPILIQPFLGLDTGYYYYNGFSEKGTEPIALDFHPQYCTTFDTRLGLHLSTKSNCGSLVSVDLAWDYRWTNLKNKRSTAFIDFGSVYNLHGAGINRNRFEASINVIQQVDELWSLYATGWVQTWSNVTSCNFTGGISANW